MELLTPQLVVLIPVVVGVVEVFKQIGLNTRYAPLLAVLLGITGSVALTDVSSATVIGGVVVGLAASGLYAGTKTTVQG